MSAKAIAAAIELPDLTPSQRLVLIVVAYHANAEAECWPSNARLTRETGLSQRGVRKILAELEALNLLERVERRMATGSVQSNLLRLTFVKPAEGGDQVRLYPGTRRRPGGTM